MGRPRIFLRRVSRATARVSVMQNECCEILDAASKLSVTLVDCTAAAGQLARGHLSGPTAAVYLAQALAGVALLGTETTQPEETVSFRLDVPTAPLGGFLVECTEKGTLRGYTKKKVLNDFDGLGAPKDKAVLGETGTCEVIRSLPGNILASGAVAVAFTGRRGFVAQGLESFYTQSLQRRVRVALVAAAGDDGVPTYARGVLVECAPDGDAELFGAVSTHFAAGEGTKALAGMTLSPRTFLKKIGLPHAELRHTKPLAFACRCSAARARDILAALPPAERATLPAQVDITCHLCGRTWTIS